MNIQTLKRRALKKHKHYQKPMFMDYCGNSVIANKYGVVKGYSLNLRQTNSDDESVKKKMPITSSPVRTGPYFGEKYFFGFGNLGDEKLSIEFSYYGNLTDEEIDIFKEFLKERTYDDIGFFYKEWFKLISPFRRRTGLELFIKVTLESKE